MLKFILISLLSLMPIAAFELPRSCKQVVLGVADDWGSSHVQLAMYEKSGSSWKPVMKSWPGRLGKNGMVWGRGLHPLAKGSAMKKEGDAKAPAGVFWIGGAYGYAPQIKKNRALSYRQITTRDLWVEDSNSPYYNRHLVIEHEPKTAWEKKQQMRQGDHAHSLKLFVAHNAADHGKKATPGGGSAIFFHIWRDNGGRATHGCTSMREDKLKEMISKVDPSKNPVFVLLPKAEYQRLKTSWKLP